MLNTNFIKIEDILKDFLQKELVLKLNNQVYKRGKFILFNKSYFTINFIIKRNKKNKNEIIKLPFPFDFYHNNNILYFDYKICNFLKNDKELIKLFEEIEKPECSKFYDKILEIQTDGE